MEHHGNSHVATELDFKLTLLRNICALGLGKTMGPSCINTVPMLFTLQLLAKRRTLPEHVR
eukprot:3609129-Amphidinium_carterae.1